MERNGHTREIIHKRSGSGGYVPTKEQMDKLLTIVANVSTSRMEWLKSKFMTGNGRRDIYKECGFDKSPTRERYRDFFKRDPIAGRVIDFMPKECWKKPPLVYEIEDGEESTPFEESWDKVGENLNTNKKLKMKSFYKKEKYNPIWSYVKRLDILSGAGSFGVMLLGFDDVKTGEDVEGKLKEPVKPKKGMKLNFIRVFPEWLVDVATRVNDLSDPRHDMPETYNITFNDPEDAASTGQTGTGPLNVTREVHWTRVIHVPSDDLHSNEVYGPPRCESVLNNIENCFKIASADPEGYWQSCFNILSAETHPSLGGDEIEINETKMRTMFEAMMQGLQRYGVFKGMALKSVAPNVVDLTPHIKEQINLICIRKNWAVRIFTGSERGELASSMDEREHKGNVTARCEGHCSANITIPLIDRLIWAGVLEEPAEENGFSLEWEDSTVHTELDRATVAKTKVEAMSAYVSGGVDAIYPPHEFLTRVMGETDEEAESILDAATEHTEEKQQQMMDQQQTMIDHGLASDPTKPPPGRPGGPGGPPAKAPGGLPKGSPGAKPFGGVRNADGLDLLEYVENVFCPTGEGGGIDPTCSIGGGRSGGGGELKEVMKNASLRAVNKFRKTKDPTDSDLEAVNEGLCHEWACTVKSALPEVKLGWTRGGEHAWVEYGGKAYDAEHPDGVSSWKKLPSAKPFSKRGASYGSQSDLENVLKELSMDPEFSIKPLPTLNVFCPTGEGGGIDPTCSPGGQGGSGATSGGDKKGDVTKGTTPKGPKPDVTVDTSNPKIKDVMSKTFGKDVDTDTLASACNALPGGKVKVSLTEGGGGVVVEVHNPNGVAKRTFYRDRDGKLVCQNDLFINKEVPGQPKVSGAEMLNNQVKSLQKMGVDRIETNAARDDGKNPPLVGYKVWPKLGYSGQIDDRTFAKLPPEVRAAMGEKPGKLLGLVGKNKGDRDIQKLYSVPGGKEAWEKFGDSIPMTFDVKPGSENVKRLEAYLKGRKAKPAANVFCPTGEGGGIDPTCGRYSSMDVSDLIKERDRLERDIQQESAAIDPKDPHSGLRSSTAHANRKSLIIEQIKVEIELAKKTGNKQMEKYHRKRLKNATKPTTDNNEEPIDPKGN